MKKSIKLIQMQTNFMEKVKELEEMNRNLPFEMRDWYAVMQRELDYNVRLFLETKQQV